MQLYHAELADGSRDFRNPRRGAYSRLRAHRNDEQLPRYVRKRDGPAVQRPGRTGESSHLGELPVRIYTSHCDLALRPPNRALWLVPSSSGRYYCKYRMF